MFGGRGRTLGEPTAKEVVGELVTALVGGWFEVRLMSPWHLALLQINPGGGRE